MYPYIYIILPTYMVLAFIGGFASLILVYLRIDTYEMEFEDFIKMCLVCILGIAFGSKFLYFITQLENILKDFSIYNLVLGFINSGFVFYGGLFGMLLAVKLYIKYLKKYDLNKIYTMITPVIPLFHCFGRIGCFFAGCCYGRELIKPITIFNVIHITRVPTQLIEALFEGLLFVFIVILERKNKCIDLLKVYLLSYAMFRFIIEFFRGDEVRGIFIFSTSQWISLVILVYYFWKSRKM